MMRRVESDQRPTLLARMLEEAHELPPWLVPAFARRHAQELGAEDATVYLQDYDQRLLVPLTDDSLQGTVTGAVRVDGTMAGRAFMYGSTVAATREDTTRLFLPLIDGTDRVGVLEVSLPAAADDDRGREGWSAFADVVAELIVSKGAHTDVYFRARRRRPMSLAAEMQWQLLPPLAVADPRVAIAGCLEPAYAVGGDAFDYAINHDTAHFAIFDAMGHGTQASVMAGVAVGAYRHARRAGIPVEEMYSAVGTAFSEQFGAERFVTAQLATLDLGTGKLALVNAGHPPPLLVRGRRVLRAVQSAAALPLGLGGEPPTVVLTDLEPDDRLVLYSDGVIDAQQGDVHYDEQRFIDDIEHVLIDELPLAETVRRINQRLLDWRGGTTRDDSTLMFVHWRTPHLPPGW